MALSRNARIGIGASTLVAIVIIVVVAVVMSSGSSSKCGTDKASMADSLKYTETDTEYTISYSGCPGYDWTTQTTPNTAKVKSGSKTFPKTPTLCTETRYIGVYTDLAQTTTNADLELGDIGLSITGVALLGNGDAEKRDAFVNEGDTFDFCGSHPSPNSLLHYHAEVPDGCIFVGNGTRTTHSELFGIMADGIPIFGPHGDDGLPPVGLDECNFHTDNTYPYGHYHVTADYAYPYLVNCLRGKITASKQIETGTCTTAGTQYNYSTLPALVQSTMASVKLSVGNKIPTTKVGA
jgi:hypothetical protein